MYLPTLFFQPIVQCNPKQTYTFFYLISLAAFLNFVQYISLFHINVAKKLCALLKKKYHAPFQS